MPKKRDAGLHSQVTDIPEVTFCCFQGEADYSLILDIYLKSTQADQIIDTASLEDMKRWCARSVRFDPNHDILFAVLDNEGRQPSVIGFSRVSWYTGMNDTRLYTQTSYLLAEWRDQGVWPVMIRRNERRLRDIAASHSFVHQRWLVNQSHTPQLWQVAWDGDQVAGMVLARIDDVDNRELKRKRGYTEHVFVRRPWRQRGLAKVLVVRSLRVLKERGMQEAELGVDSENESGAFGFYQRLGYVTFSTDIWFRKPMDMNPGAA